MARSRSIDYIRHCKVINFTELTETDRLSDDEKSLEESVLADEKRRAVNRAVSKLPADMRTAVHLVYFEEMTYEEAARVMKKSRKQVDNLLYRAKKELRVLLGEDGEA